MPHATIGYGKCYWCDTDKVVFKLFKSGILLMYICKECMVIFEKFLRDAREGKMSP
jgi:hypothetical protein